MAADIPDFSHLPVTIRRWKFTKRQSIEIDRDFVKVTEKGLFATNWKEPLSAFLGVVGGTVQESRVACGPEGRTITVHVLNLVHPDRTKNVRLYKAGEDEEIRALWKEAARALDLPALDERADGIVTRTPEDLDKSLIDLAAEGKISADFDGKAPPPQGVNWEHTQGELRVSLSLQANSYGKNVLILVGGAFALAMLLVSLGTFAIGVLYLFFGLFGVIYGSSLLVDGIFTRKIVISPKEIRYFRGTPFGTFAHKAIPLDELRVVGRNIGVLSVRPRPSHDELVIKSDTKWIIVSRLGDKQMRWLQQIILAAIIEAPRSPDE